MPKDNRFIAGDWVTLSFWEDETYNGQLLRVPADETDSYAFQRWEQCYVKVAGKPGHSRGWRKAPNGLLEFRAYMAMVEWKDPSPKAGEES